MAKQSKQEQIQVSFQVIGVDVLRSEIHRISLPFDRVDVKHFNIDVEIATDIDKKIVTLIIKILVARDGDMESVLGAFDVATTFEVEKLESLLEDAENGMKQLIYPVLIQFTSIALSTSRGVIAQITNGTLLRPCILPAVIPGDLYRNHKDAPNGTT